MMIREKFAAKNVPNYALNFAEFYGIRKTVFPAINGHLANYYIIITTITTHQWHQYPLQNSFDGP